MSIDTYNLWHFVILNFLDPFVHPCFKCSSTEWSIYFALADWTEILKFNITYADYKCFKF